MTVKLSLNDVTLLVAEIDNREGETRRDAEKRVTMSLIHDALGAGTTLGHHESGAPYVIGSDINISISHSRHYAAIAISAASPIGIDIEEQRRQLRRVAHRVMSEAELKSYAITDPLLLQAWTLKEALYKAALTPGLDFRRDIALPLPPASPTAYVSGRPYSVETLVTDCYTLALAKVINMLEQ